MVKGAFPKGTQSDQNMWSQFLGNQSIIAEKLSWPNLLLPGMVLKSKAQWRHLHWYSSVLPLPKVSKRKVGFQKPFDCTYNPSKNKPMTKKLSDDHLLNICWLSCDHMIIIWWYFGAPFSNLWIFSRVQS